MLEANPTLGDIVTKNHKVRHLSTVPANAGQWVELFVREHDGSRPHSRKCVLMIHGRSISALTTFDLGTGRYNWALSLAKAGYDVFMLDFQGSGLSPRPEMDKPCNVSQEQQQDLLIPSQLSRVCPAEYPYQLTTSQCEWDELNTVVDFIIENRDVEKVALIGVSAASFAIGPYAMKNPDKVESVLFNAPIFPPRGNSNPPAALPVPGVPMTLTTKKQLGDSWEIEDRCDGQREEGILESVWSSIMENDTIGSTWGERLPDGRPKGVLRYRNAFRWGWNSDILRQDEILGQSVPVFIIYGENDEQVKAGPLSVKALYDAIPGTHKLMFKVACTGHYMVWEHQAKFLHQFSEQWLKHGKVKGKSNGSFFVDKEGNLSQEIVTQV